MIRDFGSHIDQSKAKRLGQWATRLYIILFVIFISILYLYNAIQPQTITKTFDELTFPFYNELREKYENQLKCPCSLVTSTYNQFTHIQPVYHQVYQSFIRSSFSIKSYLFFLLIIDLFKFI